MRVGPQTGQRRRRSDRDDGDSENDDDDEDPPDDRGPRSRWTVASLSAIDRRTLNKFPPPHLDGSNNDDAVDSEVYFNVAAAKYAELGIWSDEEKERDDGVAGDEEEEAGVDLDVNHKRVLVEADGEIGEDGEVEEVEEVASGQDVVDLGAMHRGAYVPFTIGSSDPCPICARPERLLQHWMCGHCGFGT